MSAQAKQLGAYPVLMAGLTTDTNKSRTIDVPSSKLARFVGDGRRTTAFRPRVIFCCRGISCSFVAPPALGATTYGSASTAYTSYGHREGSGADPIR